MEERMEGRMRTILWLDYLGRLRTGAGVGADGGRLI